jgi:hypothetical protein
MNNHSKVRFLPGCVARGGRLSTPTRIYPFDRTALTPKKRRCVARVARDPLFTHGLPEIKTGLFSSSFIPFQEKRYRSTRATHIDVPLILKDLFLQFTDASSTLIVASLDIGFAGAQAVDQSRAELRISETIGATDDRFS